MPATTAREISALRNAAMMTNAEYGTRSNFLKEDGGDSQPPSKTLAVTNSRQA